MKKTFKVEIDTSKANWDEIGDYISRMKSALGDIVTRWDMGIKIDIEEQDNNKKKVTAIRPFKKLAITADVKWDYDEGDTPPDPKFEVSFTPDELESEGILARAGADWFLDEGVLEEFLSEYLTSFTDFCHKGFTFGWECKR